jgi:hypothetical protein
VNEGCGQKWCEFKVSLYPAAMGEGPHPNARGAEYANDQDAARLAHDIVKRAGGHRGPPLHHAIQSSRLKALRRNHHLTDQLRRHLVPPE